jgi:hypothetical protein
MAASGGAPLGLAIMFLAGNRGVTPVARARSPLRGWREGLAEAAAAYGGGDEGDAERKAK